MGYRLGIDVGGTFTDFVLVNEDGQVWEAKVSSNRARPSEAIGAGIEQLAQSRGVPVASLLDQCDLMIQGTTAALNALIQHRGAKTGLVCTKGFRDSIEIRLAYKERRFDFAYPPPPVLVPKYLRMPVEERVDKNGNIVIPLHEEDVYKAVEVFKREGVDAIAVSFLWSFLEPAHERRAGEILRKELPNTYVSLGVDVLPVTREYDRTSTTVVNSYLGPVLSNYIGEIEELLRSLGYKNQIRYMQSNGGMTSPDVIRQMPVLALNSGPAAGPVAGLYFARPFGTEDVITIDMGGTSFDACLVKSGVPDVESNVDVHRYRIGTSMININTIGAGGGSIARVDAGLLRVGPQSAEAVPGPVCYMQGGQEPTVTDADVVLGYLNPKHLLGGKLKIDANASLRAIEEKVAAPLALGVGRASLSIFNLVNRNMANAMVEISVRKGHDPRDYSLVAAGGCGPVHAGRLAQELGIGRVFIPKLASIFCAFGAIIADIRHDYRQTYMARVSDVNLDRLNAMLEEMENRGYSDLAEEGVAKSEMVASRTLQMRYLDQVYECPVEIPLGKITEDQRDQIADGFHQVHQALYTYSEQDSPCEMVNAEVTVRGKVPGHSLPRSAEGKPDPSGALIEHRPALFDEYEDYVSTPIYDGSKLQPGNVIEALAVVEEANTTIVVFPNSRLRLDGSGVYILTLDSSPMAD